MVRKGYRSSISRKKVVRMCLRSGFIHLAFFLLLLFGFFLQAEHTTIFLEAKEFGVAAPVNGRIQLSLRLFLAEMRFQELQEMFFRQDMTWGCLQSLYNFTHDTDVLDDLVAEYFLFFENAGLSKTLALFG